MSRLRQTLRVVRRRACELVGIGRYSYLALHQLDRRLEPFLGPRPGVFVEAGANDGLNQSNTYYFEAMRGWSGLLVEPLPALAARCRRNRPKSVVVQSALVAPGFAAGSIRMDVAGLMSTVQGAFRDEASRCRHHGDGLAAQGLAAEPTIEVPVATLSGLIDRHLPGREIDLLVLDVEGYEVEALAGLDLARHAPRFACIECRNRPEIETMLAPRMRPIAVLHDAGRYADVLFGRHDVTL